MEMAYVVLVVQTTWIVAAALAVAVAVVYLVLVGLTILYVNIW